MSNHFYFTMQMIGPDHSASGLATMTAMPESTTPPRWLDDDELEAWLRLSIVLMRLPLELDRQLHRDSGLSHLEYSIMAGLSDAPERSLRMSLLARWSGAQLPRLSQVVGRMEARGWVSRRPDPDDGRATLATLTDHGFDVLAAAAPGHVEEVRRLVLDPLSPAQVRQLGAAARRIMAAISPDEPDLPPFAGGRA